MIVRKGSAPPETRDASNPYGGCVRYNISNVATPGGAALRQFGVALETLMPGALSSDRHWHEAEDEFLYVLEGVATVVDDDGAHQLGPGDAACWQHGDPNGHHVQNRTQEPLSYLIVGSRVDGDICHYPDSGDRQVNLATTWQVAKADGGIVRQGDLPPELRNLMPRWGSVFDPSRAKPRIIKASMVEIDRGTPEQNAYMGEFEGHLYSDAGGLTQFGAFVEILQPGARSSDRHWHEQEDEFLFMLAGEATVIEDDGPHPLQSGDAACWPAGVPNGHHVVNRSGVPCSYLIVGSRLPSDRVHYSDIDKLYTRINGQSSRTRRDGSPINVPAPKAS